MMTQPMPTNEQYGAKFMREGVAARIKRLRDLADRIENEAESNIQRAERGKGTYGRVVGDIEHEIAWGVANLNMSGLMSTATDADIAHAKGE